MKPGVLIADRYRLERMVGEGGMSAVWETTDTQEGGGGRLALKLAMPSGVGWEEFEARFRREAAIAHYLGKAPRGFVRVRDWGRHGAQALFLVMDLVEDAEELDLVNGPLPARLERLALAAERVGDAHVLGVVHRDLKPANVLVRRRDGEVFLADFGLAKVVDAPPDSELAHLGSLTGSGMTMGTLVYMAPEQIDGCEVEGRSDVYSLAAVLYEALAGARYFERPGVRRSERALMDAICEAPPVPLRERVPWVPVEVEALLERALAKDIEARPSARELADELGRLLAAPRQRPSIVIPGGGGA
ncbi:MAG: serine/threonine protein kinase, partial [Planctomycetota bacterium]|nr:serine/threonine protein kinase [Planctomycetota bacterium]